MTAWRARLRRLWPRRLAGQLIALLLLALVLAQALSFLIFAGERRAAVHEIERRQVLDRTASLVRLLEATRPDLRGEMARTASSTYLRFWLGGRNLIMASGAEPEPALSARLAQLVGDERALAVALRGDDEEEGEEEDGAVRGLQGRDHHAGPGPRFWRHFEHDWPGLVLAVRLQDGQWLNGALRLRQPPPLWSLPSLLTLGVMALTLSVVVILTVRRITRPLERLAEAAERVGRGETVPPLAEDGPQDVREATHAFNRMQGRLQRFVQDRTAMLAAISHDLRTPITSLRLRAEFVENPETRTRILETLMEMQRMTEATLAFAREEAAREDTRVVDVSALIDSVVDDLAGLGLDVTFDGRARAPLACRPVSLKRALRNLIENACAYGLRARVALAQEADDLVIRIEDDGPGIPEADFERVFKPFVRLEESRSAATGGIGLGMAIARSIVRGHGGDIGLANRPGGGLTVTARLPRRSAGS